MLGGVFAESQRFADLDQRDAFVMAEDKCGPFAGTELVQSVRDSFAQQL